ncbi:sulfatase-like hydrolase/transferase [Chelativorans xinjiangense]|uniref:sulfatase-like hydrolase/transferase n=1 Tax=Chelativorans xinjiangense TaxID=2681485 RepID=UPI001916A3B9|nr:sulfatase-like hydrolase/transferase [Chelativorans xinjiangense]
MYQPEQFEVGLPYSAHENPPPPLRYLRERWEQGEREAVSQAAFYADDQALREAMALTAGTITMIDDRIGEVLNALEESGQAEDTIVIFTSDRSWRLWRARPLLYRVEEGGCPFIAVTAAARTALPTKIGILVLETGERGEVSPSSKAPAPPARR